MEVGVVESRKQQVTVCVDDPGGIAAPSVNLTGRAYSYNALSEDGDGFRSRLVRIYGPDASVGDDDVGLRLDLRYRDDPRR